MGGGDRVSHKPTFPLPSVPVLHGAFLFPRPKATCASFRPKFAASGSVRWLCKSVQSTSNSNCSQWDAAGAEVVTGTNLITRLRLPCGCVLARVSGGVRAPPRGRVQMDGNKESDSSNELLAE